MQYTVVGRLGRGGMGVVDLARAGDGSSVALKRVALHGSAAEMDQARRRIRREAEVLGALHHPAIVPLLDVLDDGDDVVLVMPHLRGGTLTERVAAAGPAPPAAVLAIAQRLLQALAAAHRQGVIHRDIKPANVLFDDAGLAYLGDFGVASTRDLTLGLTALDWVVGTPAYMAPEQARGEPVTPASDIFSLGATLLHALTGQGPYGNGDPQAVFHLAVSGRVGKVPPWAPPELRRMLTAMLHRDPRRRPTAAALAGGATGTAVRTLLSARPVRLAGLARRPRVGRRHAIGAAAALMVLAGTALAVRAALPSAEEAGADDVVGAPATSCEPLPYQPCGEPPAPFTDGRACVDDHDDYDADALNGCEAAPDSVDGTELVDSLEATLVPRDDVDSYSLVVDDRAQLLCDGTIRLTLTAPAGVSQRLEVLDGDEVIGRTGSTDGFPSELAVREPSCGGDDGGTLELRVSSIGADRSAEPYRLEVTGSF